MINKELSCDRLECKPASIKAVYFISMNDLVFKNGEMRIKRKYGKFKRKIIKKVL